MTQPAWSPPSPRSRAVMGIVQWEAMGRKPVGGSPGSELVKVIDGWLSPQSITLSTVLQAQVYYQPGVY